VGLIARYREQSAATAPVASAPPAPLEHATGVVHHDAVQADGSVVHHHQRFESGRLVEWELDDTPGPWALVRHGDPLDPCPTEVATPQQLAGTRLRLGERTVPLPMEDDLGDPGFAAVVRVPDATLRLRYQLTTTPVGIQRADIRYEDSLRTAWMVEDWATPEPGSPAAEAPDLFVSMSFRNYLRMRTGELTSLEAIEDGGAVDGRWTLMLLLHGLVQDPAYVATYRACAVVPPELGWWGEVAPWIGGDDGPAVP
jgi:hypothetical protein